MESIKRVSVTESWYYTHADAEVVAATVAGMPDSLGGKRMAIYVAELARAGMTPDWMPGVVPELSLKVGDVGIGWHIKALLTRRSSRREKDMPHDEG